MKLMCIELSRLVDDFYKSDNLLIKQQIFKDISLLNEALLLSEYPVYLRCSTSLTPFPQYQFELDQREEECIKGRCALIIC